MNDDNLYKPKINYIKYSRSKKVQNQYDIHKDNLKKQNININEYIKNNIIKDNLFVVTENKFPYDIDYFSHYLLWINPSFKVSYEALHNYLKNYFKKPFIYFENSHELKSIKEIIHYHIFILK